MLINLECKVCGGIFDCDVGRVSVSEDYYRPHFEKEIICPGCGKRSMDEVLLTELGQSQLTQATLGFDAEDILGSEDDELNGFDFYHGECLGCDLFIKLNDLGLCEECAGKFERDLIRERDWDYSATAYGVPASKREDLRRQVVTRYGEKLELIAASEGKHRKRKPRKRKGKRAKRGKR